MIAYRARLEVRRWPDQPLAKALCDMHPTLAVAHQCLDAYLIKVRAQSLPTLRADERLIPVDSEGRPQVTWLWSPPALGLSKIDFEYRKSWSIYDSLLAFPDGLDKRHVMMGACSAEPKRRGNRWSFTSAELALQDLYVAWGELELVWTLISDDYMQLTGKAFRDQDLPGRDELWQHMMVWCDRVETVQMNFPMLGDTLASSICVANAVAIQRDILLNECIELQRARLDAGQIELDNFTASLGLLLRADASILKLIAAKLRYEIDSNSLTSC